MAGLSVARLAVGEDFDALVHLGEIADPRVYTLPRAPSEIRRTIERSMESASRRVDLPGDEHYLMVLEREGAGLCGVAAIRAAAGSQGTFFSFRNDVIHHASRDLKISNNVHVLSLSSDLTGHSQLLSFYVDTTKATRSDALLLSRSRLALAATDRQRFSTHFFASIAGWCDEGFSSPFWDALGRKFFDMDFLEAERRVSGARNRTLIVELMPHYPVYVPLLPPSARAAIGQAHESAANAYEILTAEGFEAETYVDIFDGGPILEAHASELRTLNASRQMVLQIADPHHLVGAGEAMVAIAAPASEFRCVHCAATVHRDDGVVCVSPEAALALRATAGSRALVVAD